MTDDPIRPLLTEAANGLLYPSESDYPFAYVNWGNANGNLTDERVRELAQLPAGAPVSSITLKKFFKPVTEIKDWYEAEDIETARRFQHLQTLLETHLKKPRVFRVGETEIDAFIIGKTEQGEWTGLRTKLVET